MKVFCISFIQKIYKNPTYLAHLTFQIPNYNFKLAIFNYLTSSAIGLSPIHQFAYECSDGTDHQVFAHQVLQF